MTATLTAPPMPPMPPIPTPTASTGGEAVPARRYVAPGWFTRSIFNRLVAAATRLGLSVWGSRVLQVRGRRSGLVRETPVNLLELDGAAYLVAPRGETEWVRNLRVAGEGGLRLGRAVTPFTADELPDGEPTTDEKVAVLRAYLRRWKAEVGVFFEGATADASDEELLAIGPRHPVFRVHLDRA
jgi:deazaflavin-dependent oxidoreductase (nitroreductase family)